MIKQMVSRISSGRPADHLAGRLAGRLAGLASRDQSLAVLTYHRVAYDDEYPHLAPSLISATPPDFARQIEFLSKHFSCVSIQDVLAAEHGDGQLPPRSVLVTFDDAYEDFERNAWPVLQRYQVPVVLFVPTSFPDHPHLRFWWDQLHHAIEFSRSGSLELFDKKYVVRSSHRKRGVYRLLRDRIKNMPHEAAMEQLDHWLRQLDPVPPEPASSVMSWKLLRRLSRQGVTIAAHTSTHPLMSQVSRQRAEYEVHQSLQDTHREIGTVLPVFAYPGGAISPAACAAVRDAGIRLAFTTRRGVNRLPSADPMRLSRFNVGRNTTCAIIAAQCYYWGRKVRHP